MMHIGFAKEAGYQRAKRLADQVDRLSRMARVPVAHGASLEQVGRAAKKLPRIRRSRDVAEMKHLRRLQRHLGVEPELQRYGGTRKRTRRARHPYREPGRKERKGWMDSWRGHLDTHGVAGSRRAPPAPDSREGRQRTRFRAYEKKNPPARSWTKVK